ncbi:hypothetical protein V1514DRAFT_324678 [Lipomyces japonicus]|uniref:uncharacterized protein n=1 Tax=Lipomyces japonicus TaxID=56871 RepID=UPI0034CE6162
MTAYELHIWGPVAGLPSFDPDCLVALLYLQFSSQTSNHATNYVVIPSSNPLLSPDYRLPFIRDADSGHVIASGIYQVLRHFKSFVYDLDQHLDQPSLGASSTAVASYVNQHLVVLSSYIQRVHVVNYRSLFRPAVARLAPGLPWQYLVPVWLLTAAKDRIAHVHDVDAELDKAINDQKKQKSASGDQFAGINFFFMKPGSQVPKPNQDIPDSIIEQVKKRTAGGATEYTAVIKMLNLATDAYAHLEQQFSKPGHDEDNGNDEERQGNSPSTDDSSSSSSSSSLLYIFGNRASVADLFLIAHLAIESQLDYDVPFLNDLLAARFPILLAYVGRHVSLLSNIGRQREIRFGPVDDKDVYSLRNYVRWKTG